MPYSVVFYCLAEEDLDENVLRGKGLCDWVYQVFYQLAPHRKQQAVGTKKGPFTVSPLFAKRSPSEPGGHAEIGDHGFKVRTIKAGTQCRFRLTFLEDRLYEAMVDHVGPSTPILSHAGKSLTVTHILSSPQGADPWPCSQTYEQLLDKASVTCKKTRLQFVTPTTFCRHGGFSPLPDPQRVFKGFFQSWNWFSLMPLSADLEMLIDRHIFLSDFKVSATKHNAGEGGRPSFTGWCEFVLLGRHHEEHVKEFNLLADYSFYCGTGDHTEMGMGVTRRI